MNHARRPNRIRRPVLVALAGLLSLAPGAARAATYTLQSIAMRGELLGETHIEMDGVFEIGTLTDDGRLIFTSEKQYGARSQTLIYTQNGRYLPVAVPGQPAPNGTWPAELFVWSPIRMNQHGHLVFAAGKQGIARPQLHTYLWDAEKRQATVRITAGMPASENFLFGWGGGPGAAINNYDEIAFLAQVEDGYGTMQEGLFFLRRDGALLPVLLPEATSAAGRTLRTVLLPPSLNDAGTIGFLAQRPTDLGISSFVWAQGEITPVVVAGAPAPDGDKFAEVARIWVNDASSRVLTLARLNRDPSAFGLFRSTGGRLATVIVPGQPLPEGGRLTSVVWVSDANEAGEHAFLAQMEGGAGGAFLLAPDGRISPLLKKGDSTPWGTVTHVAFSAGISLNSRGQVALAITVSGSTDQRLILLAPAPS